MFGVLLVTWLHGALFFPLFFDRRVVAVFLLQYVICTLCSGRVDGACVVRRKWANGLSQSLLVLCHA